MRNRATFVWGIALACVGLVGMVAVWLLAPAGWTMTSGTFTSAGQRIYYTGRDSAGRAIPRSIANRGRVGPGMMGPGMMGDAACIDCHREDGRGGRIGMMFGTVEVPDIRYSVLTSPHAEEETRMPAWSDADIRRAIRDGIEPDGERLKAPMPRWNMTDAELSDVIAYLKELDTR